MPILDELTRRKRNPLELAGRAMYRFGFGKEPPVPENDTQDMIAKELIKRQIEQRFPEQMTPYQQATIDLRKQGLESRTVPKPLKPPTQRGFQSTAVVDGNVVPVRPYVPPREPKITPTDESTAKYLKEVLSYNTQEEALADFNKFKSAMELEGVNTDLIMQEILSKLTPAKKNVFQRMLQR